MYCGRCGYENAGMVAACNACGSPFGRVPMGPAMMPMRPPMMPGHGVRPATSGMAIAGLVLSFFCGVLGLILSIIAFNEVKRSQGRLTGEGLTVAGIIVSVINMIVGLAIALAQAPQ